MLLPSTLSLGRRACVDPLKQGPERQRGGSMHMHAAMRTHLLSTHAHVRRG